MFGRVGVPWIGLGRQRRRQNSGQGEPEGGWAAHRTPLKEVHTSSPPGSNSANKFMVDIVPVLKNKRVCPKCELSAVGNKLSWL